MGGHGMADTITGAVARAQELLRAGHHAAALSTLRAPALTQFAAGGKPPCPMGAALQAQLLQTRGEARLRAGEWRRAQDDLQRVADAQPGNEDVKLLLARCRTGEEAATAAPMSEADAAAGAQQQQAHRPEPSATVTPTVSPATAGVTGPSGAEGRAPKATVTSILGLSAQAQQPWHGGWDYSGEHLASAHAQRQHETPSLRNFTLAQLHAAQGCVAVAGTVFDVSGLHATFGPGGRYHHVTGRDATYCLATGSSTHPRDPHNSDLSTLTTIQIRTLRGWLDLLVAKGCSVLGRLVDPPPAPRARPFSRSELRHFDGQQELFPDGYAAPPCYVACNGVVFDVSFGGADFYGRGGPYACLAGNDASRVLAKMSMNPEDVHGELRWEGASAKERGNLKAWEAKLRARGYPVVGCMH